MAIYVPQSILGDILFLPCLFVCSLVCLFASHFYIYHNLCNIKDSNLIFGMHVFLMELHILSGERSRSKSSFKVKGQGQRSNLAILKIATWYLACMCTSWSCTFWVVKGQGHPSMSKVKFKGHIYKGGVQSVSQTHLVSAGIRKKLLTVKWLSDIAFVIILSGYSYCFMLFECFSCS
jgi:hypothetical protein